MSQVICYHSIVALADRIAPLEARLSIITDHLPELNDFESRIAARHVKLMEQIESRYQDAKELVGALGQAHGAAIGAHHQEFSQEINAITERLQYIDTEFMSHILGMEADLKLMRERLPELTGDAPGLPSKIAALAEQIQQQAQLLADFAECSSVDQIRYTAVMKDLCQHGKMIEAHGTKLRSVPDNFAATLSHISQTDADLEKVDEFLDKRLLALRADLESILTVLTERGLVHRRTIAEIPAKPGRVVIEAMGDKGKR